jgi:hypothetical protein
VAVEKPAHRAPKFEERKYVKLINPIIQVVASSMAGYHGHNSHEFQDLFLIRFTNEEDAETTFRRL